MSSSSNSIYLLAFEYAHLRKHFGLFIPTSGADATHEGISNTGTLINVVGAPLSGYHLEIQRDFDRSATSQVKKLHHLGTLPTTVLAPLIETPHDRLVPRPENILEDLAFTIPLPQKHPADEPVNNVISS
jgi:hypothetical protein